MRNKLRLNPEELRSAARQARRTASTEVLTHPRGDDFTSPPWSACTRGPRTSSEAPTHGSARDRDTQYEYDVSSPRGQAPLSPTAQLSTSIIERIEHRIKSKNFFSQLKRSFILCFFTLRAIFSPFTECSPMTE